MVDQLFVAVKAFIVHDGNVLLVRESSQYQDGANAGKFDVIGGRVKPGERFDDGLLREVQEETGLAVKVGKPFFVNEWRPTVRGAEWQIVGIFFECKTESNQVQLSNDHEEFVWMNPKDYLHYALIDNLKPAFDAFLKK